MKQYELKYDRYLVFYEIEGDVDGNHAIINSIIDENNHPVELDKLSIEDIKFHAESEYADLQHKTYMKTGELI